jgi:hypothetical protein
MDIPPKVEFSERKVPVLPGAGGRYPACTYVRMYVHSLRCGGVRVRAYQGNDVVPFPGAVTLKFNEHRRQVLHELPNSWPTFQYVFSEREST